MNAETSPADLIALAEALKHSAAMIADALCEVADALREARDVSGDGVMRPVPGVLATSARAATGRGMGEIRANKGHYGAS